MPYRFINGDAESVSKRGVAMSNPDAAEIQAVLTTTQSEIGDVSNAIAELDKVLESAQADVAQAMALIEDLYAYLEFRLLKEASARKCAGMKSCTCIYPVKSLIRATEQVNSVLEMRPAGWWGAVCLSVGNYCENIVHEDRNE